MPMHHAELTEGDFDTRLGAIRELSGTIWRLGSRDLPAWLSREKVAR
jgi:hypothetical protein